jgi:type IV secretory pathway VirB2 component (pilin)
MCLKNKLKLSLFNLYPFLLATFSLAFLSGEAHATGLQKAKGILEIIKAEILSIVPIIAIIVLIALGVGYAMGSVQKETFMRWAVGLIIVGSAAQITTMLMG